ncbi:hypothetical protein EMPG_12878, partial [Blastomyces silverae]
ISFRLSNLIKFSSVKDFLIDLNKKISQKSAADSNLLQIILLNERHDHSTELMIIDKNLLTE